MTNTANHAEIIATVIQSATDRIATCEIYVNRRALVSHNFIVVSETWNGRGIYTDGNRMAVGPFKNQMPTCYTRRDADVLAADANAEPAFKGERFKVVSSRDWWTVELEEARKALAAAQECAASITAA